MSGDVKVASAFIRRMLKSWFGMDGREFSRFSTQFLQITHLILPDGRKILVDNIGYGGVSAHITDEEWFYYCVPGQSIKATLFILGRSFPFELSYANSSLGRVGLAFVHQSTESLGWLRHSLEPIRVGSYMVPFDTTLQSKAHVQCFSGAMSSTLKLVWKSGEVLEQMDLAFQEGAIPSKLQVNEEEIVYRRFDDEQDDDILALEDGFLILYGLMLSGQVKGLTRVLTQLYHRWHQVQKQPSSLEAS